MSLTRLGRGLQYAASALNPFDKDSNIRSAGRELPQKIDQAANDLDNAPIPYPMKAMGKFSLGVGGAGVNMNPLMTASGISESAKTIKEKGVSLVLREAANSIANDAVNHPEKLAGSLLTAWAGGSATSKLVSAPTTGRVLWTGGDKAQDAAIQFAQQTGGRTLEMTCTGKLLSGVQRVTGYEPIKGLWDRASQNFARGAQGPANVFMNPEMAHAGSTFARKELPELIKNGNAVNYNTVK